MNEHSNRSSTGAPACLFMADNSGMIVINLRWFCFIYFVRNPHLHLLPAGDRRRRGCTLGGSTWTMNFRWNVRTLETSLVHGGWGGGGGGGCFENASPSFCRACLPVYHSVWFVGSHHCPRPPPQSQPNPPLLTGLSSKCASRLSALLSSKSNLGARYKYVSENKGGDRLIM